MQEEEELQRRPRHILIKFEPSSGQGQGLKRVSKNHSQHTLPSKNYMSTMVSPQRFKEEFSLDRTIGKNPSTLYGNFFKTPAKTPMETTLPQIQLSTSLMDKVGAPIKQPHHPTKKPQVRMFRNFVKAARNQPKLLFKWAKN